MSPCSGSMENCMTLERIVIAPTAIGTVRNDIYSGPTGTLPRPIS